MEAMLAGNSLDFLNPLRLAGPIFDKELRTASRRERLYVLRFTYVCVLATVFLWFWSLAPRSTNAGGAVVQISRLGELGKQIVTAIVWFQFITGQLLAAMLLSDAIGAEIRQRTLDSLLVTPVRSFQIVVGKLAGRLLQAASLLAVSLPMLAVVRVFGGVPWDYVVAGLCVTASAAVFCGALSLMCSISSRQPHQAVTTVVVWYLVIWVLLPIVLTVLSGVRFMGATDFLFLLRLTNPLVAMGELTARMVGSARGMPSSVVWPWHCLVLLALAGAVLAWSMRRVRQVAFAMHPSAVSEGAQKNPSRRWSRGAIRPVTGSPIVWKERCTPLFKTTRWGASIMGLLAIALIVVALVICLILHGPIYAVLFPVVWGLQLIFAIDLTLGAAGAITREREARTWPILLMTPLNDAAIVNGKAIGMFRRALPLLVALLVLHSLMLLAGLSSTRTLSRWTEPAIFVPVSLASTTVFLLGAGLYFSSRLKTTTAAVTAMLAAYYLPKLLFCGFLSPLFAMSAGTTALVVGRGGGSTASWLTWVVLAPAAIYIAMGILFLRLAARGVRRNIF